jgi:hypothetical protein
MGLVSSTLIALPSPAYQVSDITGLLVGHATKNTKLSPLDLVHPLKPRHTQSLVNIGWLRQYQYRHDLVEAVKT